MVQHSGKRKSISVSISETAAVVGGLHKKRWATRFTFGLMLFIATMIFFSTRSHLGVAIVGMVNSGTESNDTMPDQCPSNNESEDDEDIVDEFDWSGAEVSLVLSGFSFGFFTTQLLGGVLAERYGAKWVVGFSVLIVGLLSLVAPVIAGFGSTAMLAIRILQGAFQGPLMPAIYTMASKWTPINEKNRMMTFINTGGKFGNMLIFPITGVMTSELGWESSFYLLGIVSCVWFVLFVFLCFESPAQHPRILQSERQYIEEHASPNKGPVPFPPLLKIFTSRAYWAMQLTQLGNNWVLTMVMTGTSLYLVNIQHVPLSQVGVYNALHYGLVFVLSFPMSWTADWMINSGKFSTIFVRKLFNSIGTFGPAVGLIGLAFAKCNTAVAVASLTIGMGLNGGVFQGFKLTPTDIAPRYSGSLTAMGNSGANIIGFIAPIITGIITEKQTTESWQNVYLLSALMSCAGGLIFLIFGSADEQHWNDMQNKKKEKNEDAIENVS